MLALALTTKTRRHLQCVHTGELREMREEGKEPEELGDRLGQYLYLLKAADPFRQIIETADTHRLIEKAKRRKMAHFCSVRAYVRMSVSSAVQLSRPSRPSNHLQRPPAAP